MKVNIKETYLEPLKDLSERGYTDMIVIHHTGCSDIDASAEQIDDWHKNQGWSMVGYHFIVRKNGTIERGRPEWAIGSHAYGENSHTLGIHLSGDFEQAYPTSQQIEMTAMLIAYLAEKYDIEINRSNIVGHCDLMSTDCPGKNLYSQLQTIIDKAAFYLNQSQNPQPQNSPNLSSAENSTAKINEVEVGKSVNLTDEEIIWKFLKGKGFNDFAAAGIMGNLYAESGLSSINLENKYEKLLGMSDEQYTNAVDFGTYNNFVYDKAGYGLAQWTYYSRKQNLLTFAKAKGTSIGNLDMQLEFLFDELQSYSALMNKLHNADSVLAASNAMLLDFERPADQSVAVQNRRAGFAQDFYDDFAGSINMIITKEDDEMRFDKLSDLPDWAKPTIQKMIDKGFLGGNSKDSDGNPTNLDLSLDMVRIFVVNDRAGLY